MEVKRIQSVPLRGESRLSDSGLMQKVFPYAKYWHKALTVENCEQNGMPGITNHSKYEPSSCGRII
jgi:hypothetical protein